MIRALILLCVLAFVAEAKKPPPPPPQCSAFGWCNQGIVAGVVGNYAPVVIMGGSQIRVYANTNGTTDGNLYVRVGSWSSVGSASMVLDITDPRDTYIRTSGIARGASGTYYAVLYSGDGYPTQGGYSPSWAVSTDGYNWTWVGPITLFGRNQSSAAALVVDEGRTDDYRFMFWMDIGTSLYLVHSADGATWVSDGLNQWPIAGEQAQFASAAQTPYGYHIIAAINYPATAHRHVFSCTGLPPWRVIEMDAGTRGTAQKGTNLVYDSVTNTLHALTSGVHYTLQARAFPC